MFSTQNRFRKQGLAQAAGITALSALAGGAEASPVYSGLQNLLVNQVTTGDNAYGNLDLDLNGDSTNDLSFNLSTYIPATASNITLFADAALIHTTAAGKLGNTTRFSDGNAIDAAAFSTSSNDADSLVSFSGGSLAWNINPSGYVGFQLSSGEYGWLFITSYLDGTDSTLTVRDWAYESVSGAGILAGDTGQSSAVPEPGTAVLMLAASIAMAVKRRPAH